MSKVYLAVLTLLGVTLLLGAKPPEGPKISSYAPAEDLMGQVEYYLGRLNTSLASEDEYFEAQQARVQKDALTLLVLSTALGLHDTDNPVRRSAPALASLAAQIAESHTDYSLARQGLDAYQSGLENGVPGDAPPVTWERDFHMGPLMKQAGTVNNTLRRGLSKRSFERDAPKSAGYAALLAVFGQATLADAHGLKYPDKVDKWYELSAAWRDEAGAINAAVRQRDYEAASGAVLRMTKACDDCHAVFRKE